MDAPKLPNGGNPLIERMAYAADRLGLNRAKVNWGYIALASVGAPGVIIVSFACWHQQWEIAVGVFKGLTAFSLPIVSALVIGNVALKALRNGNAPTEEPPSGGGYAVGYDEGEPDDLPGGGAQHVVGFDQTNGGS